jgi:hypothetical protein
MPHTSAGDKPRKKKINKKKYNFLLWKCGEQQEKKCITFRDFIFILIKYNTPQPQSRSSTNHQSAFVALATFSLFFFSRRREKIGRG